MNILGVNHITIAVSDVEEAFRFYTELLGLVPVMKSEVAAYVSAGGAWIALVADENAGGSNQSHVAFTVDEDEFAGAVEELKRAKVREWRKLGTEGESFFFLDPSGNKLELHVGSLRDRLAHGRLYWADKVQWYEG